MITYSWEEIRQKLFIAKFFIIKNITIFYRSHLSHVLAVFLAVCAVLREVMEHFQYNSLLKPWAWLTFIIILAVFTVWAAIWELVGNKLATSKQEVRFILGMNALLEEYNAYERKLQDINDEEQSKELFKEFIKELLKAASGIICGKHTVDVGLMLEKTSTKELILEKDKFYQSDAGDEHKYPERLVIPLDEKEDSKMVGPAEMAFKKKEFIIHMPNKSKKMGLLIQQSGGEDYTPKGVFEGWYPADHETQENFRSVLSVPVISYKNENESEIFGVLNFTTRNNDLYINRDLFVDRDYIMASCFAVMIAQSIVASRKRVAEISQASNSPVTENT